MQYRYLGRYDMPLGLEDQRIADPQITASTHYNLLCGPWNARLHRTRGGRFGGSWCAKTKDSKQWLRIDFGAPARLTRVQTQGRQDADQWVTSYTISYSKKGDGFLWYQERGRKKV